MRHNGSRTAVTEHAVMHQALTYGSDEEFRAGTVPFVRKGLSYGARVLAVTTGANIRLLRDALGGEAERVDFIDSSDWFHAPSWTLRDHYRYAHTSLRSHPGFRLLGEPMKPGRTALENKEWARYESLLNAAFADAPVAILCPYDVRNLHPEVVAEARRTHPELLTADGPQLSPDYLDPAALSAEYDRSELPEPASTLDHRPITRSNLSEIRRLVHQEGCRQGLSTGRAEDVAVAVNEVAANAIQHGGGRGRLRLWTHDHQLIVEVSDPGGRIDDPLPGHLPPDPHTPRGHGLWLTRQLCDLVQTRSGSGGCTQRLHFFLP